MPSSLTCPLDPELLAVAAGEEPPDDLRAHLAGCSICCKRLQRLEAELAQLRETTRSAKSSWQNE